MQTYQTDLVLSFSGTLKPSPEVIGQVPEGIRVNFYPASGAVSGPRLRGLVRDVGGDWLTLRRDGVAQLDVRTTIETEDGALLLLTYHGVADFGHDGYQRFLKRDLPGVVRIRITPRFTTAHPDYLWCNRLHCFGVGEYSPATLQAHYDVYAIL
jgi:hypothetical protein